MELAKMLFKQILLGYIVIIVIDTDSWGIFQKTIPVYLVPTGGKG